MLGVSFDTAAENTAFATKFTFPFPLLCDAGRAIGLAYGACDAADAKNARRVGVVIDRQGKVAAWHAKVDAKGFPAQALAAVASLPRA